MTNLDLKSKQTGIRQRSLRKHCRVGRATELVFVLATGIMLVLGTQANAQSFLNWDAGNTTDADDPIGGNGVWSEGGTKLWEGDFGQTAFASGDRAIFGSPDGYTVTVHSDGVTARDIFLDADDITIAGGPLTVTGKVSNDPGTSSFISASVTGDLRLDVDGTLNLSGTVSGTVQTRGTGQVDIVNIVGALNSDAGTTKINGSGSNLGTVTGTTTIDNSTVEVLSNGRLTGATTVNSNGTLKVTGPTASVGIVTVNTGGVLDLAGSDTTVADLAGTGSVTNTGGSNPTLTVGGNQTTTFSGVISGSGGLTVDKADGAGTLTLSGANTFDGVTTVIAGTLNIQNAAALGTTAGGTTVKDGATLQLEGGITTAEAITLNGTGVGGTGALQNVSGNNTLTGLVTLESDTLVTSDAGGLVFDGGVTGTGSDLAVGGAGTIIFSRAISTGTGTFTKNGSGITNISNSSFTGATTVNEGQLFISGGSSLSDTALLTVKNGATLVVAGNERIGSLTGGGIIQFQTGGTLTAGDETSTAFSGQILADEGGNLTKRGTGTLTLSGASTYKGTTTVREGTLNIQNDDALGTTAGGTTVEDGATLQLEGDNITTAEAITLNGTGVGGAGALQSVSGINRLNGLVTLESDTLVTSDSGGLLLQGGVTGTDTNLTVDGAGTISVRSAIATGSGTFTKNGSGFTDFSAPNTFTGATTVNEGRLDIFGGSSLSDTALLTVKSGATLGVISDETIGSLTGGGTIDFLSDATLTVGDGTDTVFAGKILADEGGNLTKQGAGTLTLSGASTYKGNTTLSAGGLVVNGSLTSEVIANAGRLSGTGQIGGLTANAGATVAPGNSIGTMDVAGDVTFAAGSVLEVEVDPTGTTSDLIAATGTATLNGGTVSHIGNDGTYQPTASYTILTAAGGVTGEFAGVTSTYTFLDPTLNYSANAVVLTLERNDLAFGTVAQTANQRATAAGIDSLPPSDPLVTALFPLGAAQARAAFDSLSGEVHGATGAGLVSTGLGLSEALNDRARAQTPAGASPEALSFGVTASSKGPALQEAPRAWASAIGNVTISNATDNTARTQTSTGGFMLGFDAYRSPTVTAGFYAAQTGTFIDISDRNSTARTSGPYLGIYAFGTQGKLRFSTSLTYGWNTTDSDRDIVVGGVSNTLTARYKSRSIIASGEIGYGLTTGTTELEPFVNLTHIHTASEGFTEAGGAGAITRGAQTSNTTLATLGVNADRQIEVGGLSALLSGSFGVRHAFGKAPGTSTHALVGGNAFAVQSGAMDRSTVVLDAGIDIEIASNANLSLGYQGVLGEDNRSHNVSAALKISF